MQKIIKEIRVKNALGLHTRPATEIVKMLRNVKSSVFFTYKKETINAKSILSILMLGASRNALLTVEVAGEDAFSVMQELETAFENQFGESNVSRK